MPGICILTDNTAQFPLPVFPGQQFVSVIPLQLHSGGKRLGDGKEWRVSDLPLAAGRPDTPTARPASPEEFRQAVQALSSQYDEVVAILSSGQLNQTVANAEKAALAAASPAPFTVIDSQTTGVGLGLLVQSAARAVEAGATCPEIKRLVRNRIAHVYTVFCVQSLTYLARSGLLDPAQALVGEMLGVTSLFLLENGRLIPLQKARNSRQLVDMLHEFVLEFSQLEHVALSRGVIPFESEARSLRERVCADFPGVQYSEHVLGTALAAILGPRSLSFVAMEEA
jgi:DegV family protein with EDD domain